MIRLVGFCGPAGAGKTTAARLLYGQGFERVRFADPLKRMLAVLGLSEAEIDGADKEKPSPRLCGQTPRWAMQSLGTEWGRQCIGRDFWLDAWARIADERLRAGGLVVVDDVRFSNEARAIWARGGRVIRIERRGAAAGDHVSEHLPPDMCDVTVNNDGDKQALAHAVAVALSKAAAA